MTRGKCCSLDVVAAVQREIMRTWTCRTAIGMKEEFGGKQCLPSVELWLAAEGQGNDSMIPGFDLR